MLNREELENRSFNAVGKLADSLFKERLEIQFDEADVDWDPILHRTVFTQSFVLWRPFDQLRIGLSNGRVVSFHDANRFKDAKFELLENDVIMNICKTTGIVSEDARLSYIGRGHENMLLAEVVEPLQARIIRFTINPTLKQVAAFETAEY